MLDKGIQRIVELRNRNAHGYEGVITLGEMYSILNVMKVEEEKRKNE